MALKDFLRAQTEPAPGASAKAREMAQMSQRNTGTTSPYAQYLTRNQTAVNPYVQYLTRNPGQGNPYAKYLQNPSTTRKPDTTAMDEFWKASGYELLQRDISDMNTRMRDYFENSHTAGSFSSAQDNAEKVLSMIQAIEREEKFFQTYANQVPPQTLAAVQQEMAGWKQELSQIQSALLSARDMGEGGTYQGKTATTATAALMGSGFQSLAKDMQAHFNQSQQLQHGQIITGTGGNAASAKQLLERIGQTRNYLERNGAPLLAARDEIGIGLEDMREMLDQWEAQLQQRKGIEAGALVNPITGRSVPTVRQVTEEGIQETGLDARERRRQGELLSEALANELVQTEDLAGTNYAKLSARLQEAVQGAKQKAGTSNSPMGSVQLDRESALLAQVLQGADEKYYEIAVKPYEELYKGGKTAGQSLDEKLEATQGAYDAYGALDEAQGEMQRQMQNILAMTAPVLELAALANAMQRDINAGGVPSEETMKLLRQYDLSLYNRLVTATTEYQTAERKAKDAQNSAADYDREISYMMIQWMQDVTEREDYEKLSQVNDDKAQTVRMRELDSEDPEYVVSDPVDLMYAIANHTEGWEYLYNKAGQELLDGTEVEILPNAAAYMTEDELGMFNYLYNSGDKKGALDFVRLIAPNLIQRQGAEMAEKMDVPVVRQLYSVLSGVRNWGRSMRQLFRDTSVEDGADEAAIQELMLRNQDNDLARITMSAGQSIGQMAPALTTGYLLGPLGGAASTAGASAMTFFSTKGGAYTEGLREGMTPQQASQYSTLVGAAEAGMGSVLSGVGGVTGGWLSKTILKRLGTGAQTALKAGFKKWAVNLAGELVEENIQNYLEPAFKMMVGAAEEYDAPSLQDFIDTSLSVAISTSLLGAGETLAPRNAVNQYREELKSLSEEYAQLSKREGMEGLAAYAAELEAIAAGKLKIESTEDGYALSKDIADQVQRVMEEAARYVNNATIDQAVGSLEKGSIGDLRWGNISEDYAMEAVDDLEEAWKELKASGSANTMDIAQAARLAQQVMDITVHNAKQRNIITQEQKESAQQRLGEIVQEAKTMLGWEETASQKTEETQNTASQAAMEEGAVSNEAAISDDGTQRNEGLGAGGQTGTVAESTVQPDRRRQAESEAAYIRNVIDSGKVQKVSPASIGVDGGSEEASVYVLPEDAAEASETWKKIRDDAQKHGEKLVLFSGDLRVKNAATGGFVSVEGVRQVADDGTVTVYAKADAAMRDAGQIYQHETFHGITEGNESLLKALVKELDQRYGKQEIARMVRQYGDAYKWIYGEVTETMTVREVEELAMRYLDEVFADVYAGIQRGRIGTKKAASVLEANREAVEGARERGKSGSETRKQMFSVNESFEHDFDRWLNEKDEFQRMTDGGWFLIGETSEALQKAGIRKSKIHLRKQKAATIMDEHPNMTRDVMVKLPELLEDPIVVTKSKTRDDSVLVLGELEGNNGEKVSVALNLVPTATGRMDAEFTLLASAYTRSNENIRSLLKSSEIVYLSEDKKRTNTWLMSLRLQLPSGQPAYGSIGTIAYGDGKVNISGRKNMFSIEEEVAQMDAEYRRAMARDAAEDEPAATRTEYTDWMGTPEDTDYHLDSAAEKRARAENWNVSLLNSMIKKAYDELRVNKIALDAIVKTGGDAATARRIQLKMGAVRETVDIYTEVRDEKRAAEKAKEKKTKAEKKQQEIRQQKARTAQTELRQDLMNLFSVKAGSRLEAATLIDNVTDQMVRRGGIDNETRKELFDALYASGEELVRQDEYMEGIRDAVKDGRIYVPESVRAKYGSDWENFRKAAWGNKIYLTNMESDAGIDVWTEDLKSVFPGSFDSTMSLRDQLDQIVALAEAGKPERLTLAQMMAKNQAEQGWSIEEQMEQLEEKVDQMLETFADKADLEIRLRQQSLKKLIAQQEGYQRSIEARRERLQESTARNQVLKQLKRLNRMHDKAAPEQKKAIRNALRDLDIVARRISVRGIEDLQVLLDSYAEFAQELGEENFVRDQKVEDQIQRLKKKRLDDLNLTEVQELGQAVSKIITDIQNSNRVLSSQRKQTVAQMAKKVVEEVSSTPGSKDATLRKLKLAHMDAKRLLGELSGWQDGAMQELSQALQDGQEKMMHYQMDAQRIFDEFMAEKANAKWVEKSSGKGATWKTVKVDGIYEVVDNRDVKLESIELTPMMMVSMLMHSKNNDNLWHIGHFEQDGDKNVLVGGLRLPERTAYEKGDMKNAYARGKTVKITPEAVRKIAAMCTAQEKAFAELLEKYFDGLAKDAINSVSLVLDGYERAMTANYFPIESDKSFLVQSSDFVKTNLQLTSDGSLRHRTHNAQNPIYLTDASAALTRNIDFVSKYYGLALPLRDLNAVLNATYYDASGKKLTWEEENFGRNKKAEGWGALQGLDHTSVKNAIAKTWGDSSLKYIEKLMADLQRRDNSSDVLTEFMAKIRGNTAQAVIAFNPSSVLKQTASFATAATMLDTSSLIKALGTPKSMKADVKTLEKYSAVYWYRNQGNATQELRDAMERKSFGEKLPLGYGLTQRMDSAVTRQLLLACEYQVQKDLGLAPGSQAEIDAGTDRYWSEVAKLFNKVVLDTQSNTSILERPQITRVSAGNASRWLTMFRTDAFQTFNIITEATGRLRAANRAYKANPTEANKAKLNKARKRMAKTQASIFVSQTIVALATAIIKMLTLKGEDYLDEEGNLDWAKAAKTLGYDIVEGYAGLLLLGDTMFTGIMSAFDDDVAWYEVSFSSVDAVNDAMKLIHDVDAAIEDADTWTIRGIVKDGAKTIGQMLGIPVSNMEKYLWGAVRLLNPGLAEQRDNFYEETTKASLSKESAYTREAAIGVIMDNRTEGLGDQTKAEIARLYAAGGTGAVPTGLPTSITFTTEDGEEAKTELDANGRDDYREAWSDIVSKGLPELMATEAYAKADNEGKAALIAKLYRFAADVAAHSVVPEKELDKWVRTGLSAMDAGVPIGEYIDFYMEASEKLPENMKASGINAFVDANYLMRMGWTDEQEELVYNALIASESKAAQEEALRKAGLTWEQTASVVTSTLDNKDKMEAIGKMDVSNEIKAAAMSVFASDSRKKQIAAGLRYQVPMEAYAEVLANADADRSGSISQDEATTYIREMSLGIQDKAYVWQMITDAKDGKANPFSDHFGQQLYDYAHRNDKKDNK